MKNFVVLKINYYYNKIIKNFCKIWKRKKILKIQNLLIKIEVIKIKAKF